VTVVTAVVTEVTTVIFAGTVMDVVKVLMTASVGVMLMVAAPLAVIFMVAGVSMMLAAPGRCYMMLLVADV
jgi:hypothetical protein